ncbi:SMP domain-containing protein [Nonlabens ulvanivorans]|uniref:Lipoprotein n=1 Tax=Nonlabens ulvanivorans TaxID=906888 RepID=A0A084JWG0_NONUL|nr:hypothetical protein [Nonlabens ulvanivorans]KEZ93294.1 hypothetical protein IL45_14350 [Nonlabens ulvanivorans]PRX13582.1 hypothetical protein LY02_01826 [Nonlabens ulvanivorans]
MKNLFTIFIFTLCLMSCDSITGEEIGRLSINKISTDNDNKILKEFTVDLKMGDEIGLWSDMDIEYNGEVTLTFKLTMFKNRKRIATIDIDPTDKYITIGEMQKSINGKTDWSFLGKNTSLTIDDNATYTFKGILIATKNPTLQIDQAEVVFKRS